MIRMDNYSPIGFFDSGVGGLSVYSEFNKILPCENTLYFGDLKNMPYGNKSKDELVSISEKIFNYFSSAGVKAVVIACNTSSATTYELLKDNYDFKIYPIIQSCAKVIASEHSGRIGVFATTATIKTGAYKRELQKYNPEIEVIEHACPKWTGFVESGNIFNEECISDVKAQMDSILSHNPDRVILGCTHYPYLIPVLTRFAPKELFIDPAKIFTLFIKADLEVSGLLNSSGKTGKEEFLVSAEPDKFMENAKYFYNVDVPPGVVNLA